MLSLIVFATGFLYYTYLQLRYPLLYGVDEAFYAGETKCILLLGHPCLVEPRLPLYIPAFFALLGLGVELSVKLTLALFTSLTVIPFYLLSSRVSRNSFYPIILSALYLLNPFTMRLGVEFLKNVVALLFFMLWLYYFYIVFVNGSIDKYKYLYVTALLTAFSHILVYGLLLLFTFIALSYSMIFNRKILRRLVYVFLFEAVLAVIGVTTPLFGWLSYFKAVSREAPQLAVFKTINYLDPETLLAFFSLALTAYIVLVDRTSKSRTVAVPLLGLEVLAFIPLPLFAGISWRMLLMFSVYLPLSIILSYRILGPRVFKIIAVIALLSSLLLSVGVSLNYYKPLMKPYVVEELEEVLPRYLNDKVVLIVPDKILMHWVFYIVSPHKVFNDYDYAIEYLETHGARPDNYLFLEILYSPDPSIEPPKPGAGSILLYRGEYVYIYKIEAYSK